MDWLLHRVAEYLYCIAAKWDRPYAEIYMVFFVFLFVLLGILT